MSQIISTDPFSQLIDGFQFPGMFTVDNVRSTINYKARPDDIFLVTYPKCGTTWVGNILLLMFQNGQPLTSSMDMFFKIPYIELLGSQSVEGMMRPLPIKTHLPFHLAPFSKESKYIYVTRNPKDCCVSYFHHMRNGPVHGFTGTFDEFFELFISGKTDYGDYFDHLMSWYPHRNDPNVLFITYEQLKEDIDSVILKMASFIDDQKYAEPLQNNPELMNNIKNHSSLKEMKEFMQKAVDDMINITEEDLQNSPLPEVMKSVFLKMKSSVEPGAEGASDIRQNMKEFIRKGIIGDWRNYFSEDQSRRLEQKFIERTKGTDIPQYFQKYMR